ncbi:uncharacterized protein Z520_06145 [Fonsecaea multimorphosa CBS 102226]|uniref:Methyltransferase type 11 domain-containing protein n=1 Tax=Fonsecaea multimorphosa CBS 102226 TaxID=1442371 RepID=A0A0D2H876_9EURO|nr:uncharacterized protein Z520_06145 [Fonsecaea multimorphosa CBS 102226]KIX98065.1 hypothetical protein Z520_06145 [Fonsecaea multimorphosa CBS 102226]OAL24149.1 hypothetical protein AYO22_05808 [Fonsecaea multimorphosa]
MAVPLLVRLQSYMDPLFLLSISIAYLPLTLVSHPLLLVTSPSSFRSKWFESFWRVIGPKMAASEVQVDHIEELLSRAAGKVLELGPGAGDQMFHYKPGQIEVLYCAEPNVFLHGLLLQAAEKNGLGKKLVALEAGAQPASLLPALKQAGVISSTTSSLPEDGVFDTIVAVKSLCSAPQKQLAATVAVVQALLKPGGEFLFFEHVENNADSITKSYVWFIDWIWPVFMGGCRLTGKLDRVVLGMGGWDERKITTTDEFKGHEV